MTHTLLAPEKDFRWRAGEITRLEAFCDVVFGFAITLLVVSLEVPRSYSELMTAMRGFLPFAVCFAQLVLIWFTHYRLSRRYGLQDTYSVVLNVVLLFVVLFYVYPLKFLFTMLFAGVTHIAELEPVPALAASVLMRIYAAGFASVFALFVLMYLHAYRLRGALQLNAVEVYETLISLQENLALMLIGVGSFFVAFWSPAWAGWMYAATGPFFWIHGAVMGRRKRLLASRASAASHS
ncbi:MAG TPA: TMEM175 family protein [Terriglobales bacterium]|nr:TMEM175 family protein [Terriglobales bacterium]